MAVHVVNHSFDFLNTGGHAVEPNSPWIGVPVGCVVVDGYATGWWGDSEKDLPGVEAAMRKFQSERWVEESDNARNMQPHIVKYKYG